MMRLSEKRRTFRKFLCASVLSLQLIDNVFAQSNPGLYYNFTPTAGQWNSYFSSKADYPALFGATNTWANVNTFLGLVNFGAASIASGTWNFLGSSSGTLIVTTQANAGTWNWVLPNSIGGQGSYLQSGGTASAPQTWGQAFYVNAGFAQSVNLNSVADTQINLSLPTTNYILIGATVLNTGTSSGFSAGAFSLCSLAGATGTCPINGASLTGITTAGINTAGNLSLSTVQNFFTNISTWFFRITTPTGVTSTGTVIVTVRPMPGGFP